MEFRGRLVISGVVGGDLVAGFPSAPIEIDAPMPRDPPVTNATRAMQFSSQMLWFFDQVQRRLNVSCTTGCLSPSFPAC